MQIAPAAAPPHPGAGSPPSADAWKDVFGSAMGYADYLAAHATPDQRARWDASHARIRLSADQQALLGSFVRRMPVLVLCGAWCGDCVNQCPIFDHFASASKAIDLKFLDRDARPDIAAHLKVCGGQRVPVAMFLAEDWQPVVFYGDRTLAAYRASAAAESGQACASGITGPSGDLQSAVIADWLRKSHGRADGLPVPAFVVGFTAASGTPSPSELRPSNSTSPVEVSRRATSPSRPANSITACGKSGGSAPSSSVPAGMLPIDITASPSSSLISSRPPPSATRPMWTITLPVAFRTTISRQTSFTASISPSSAGGTRTARIASPMARKSSG